MSFPSHVGTNDAPKENKNARTIIGDNAKENEPPKLIISTFSYLEKALNESTLVNDANDASIVKEIELNDSQDLEVEQIEMKQPLVKK